MQILLTKESIQAAREYFAANCLTCMAEAKAGKFHVNDLWAYCLDERKRHDEFLAGKWDHTFTVLQMAHYIQTGEMRALLP